MMTNLGSQLSSFKTTRIVADFYSVDKRNYLANAVVIADALNNFYKIFGNITNFVMKFKKAFLGHAELIISLEPVTGNIVGEFEKNACKFYYAYVPLQNKEPLIDICSEQKLQTEFTHFTFWHNLTNICKENLTIAYMDLYGKLEKDKKVIFYKLEIPDTTEYYQMIAKGTKPEIQLTKPMYLDNARFNIDVYLNEKLLARRFSSVKEFIL